MKRITYYANLKPSNHIYQIIEPWIAGYETSSLTMQGFAKESISMDGLEISKPGTAKREESRHSTVMNALAAGIVVDGNHLLDNVSLLTLNDVEENENN